MLSILYNVLFQSVLLGNCAAGSGQVKLPPISQVSKGVASLTHSSNAPRAACILLGVRSGLPHYYYCLSMIRILYRRPHFLLSTLPLSATSSPRRGSCIMRTDTAALLISARSTAAAPATRSQYPQEPHILRQGDPVILRWYMYILALATRASCLITAARWAQLSILILGFSGHLSPQVSYGEIITTGDNPGSQELDPIIPLDELKIPSGQQAGDDSSGQQRSQLLTTTDIIPINQQARAIPLYINMLWIVDQSYGTASGAAATELMSYIMDKLADSSYNIKLKMGLVSNKPLPGRAQLDAKFKRFGSERQLIFTQDENIYKYVTLEGAMQHLALGGYSQIFRHSTQYQHKRQKNIMVFITKEDSKHYPPPRQGGWFSNFWKIAGVVVANMFAPGAALALLGGLGTGALIDHAITTSKRDQLRRDYYKDLRGNKYQRRMTGAASLIILKEFFAKNQAQLPANFEIWSIVGGAATQSYADTSPAGADSPWQLVGNTFSRGAYYPSFKVTDWNAEDRQYYTNHRKWHERVGVREDISDDKLKQLAGCPEQDPASRRRTFTLCEVDYVGLKASPNLMAELAEDAPNLYAYFRDEAQTETFKNRRLALQSLRTDLPKLSIDPTYTFDENANVRLSRLTFAKAKSSSPPRKLEDYRDFIASSSLRELSPQPICNTSQFRRELEEKKINPRPQCIDITAHRPARDAGCKKRTGHEYLKLARRTGGLAMTPCAVAGVLQKDENLIDSHLTALEQILAATASTIKLRRRAHSITQLHFKSNNRREQNPHPDAVASVIRLWNAELAKLRADPNYKSMLVSHRGDATSLHLYFNQRSFDNNRNDDQPRWTDLPSGYSEFTSTYKQHAQEKIRTLQISYTLAAPPSP